jgi:hypothetical protein
LHERPLTLSPMNGVPRYRYCKLYVRSVDRRAVTDLIAQALKMTAPGFTVIVPSMTLDIVRNPEGDPSEMLDFVRWPTLVDVNSETTISADVVVSRVADILRLAWASEMPMVAACQFEGELPWSGGIDLVGR